MDWLPFILQVASVFGVTLTSVGAFLGILVSLRNGRLALAIAQRGAENAKAISDVRVTVNGRLEELLNAKIALARAEGAAEARADPEAHVVAAGKLLESAITAKASLDQAVQTLVTEPPPDEQARSPRGTP